MLSLSGSQQVFKSVFRLLSDLDFSANQAASDE